MFIHLASSHIRNNGEQGFRSLFLPSVNVLQRLIGCFTSAVQCVEVMFDSGAGTEDRKFAPGTVRNESFTVKTVLNCEL